MEAVFDAEAVQAELRSSQAEVLREAAAALEARCSTQIAQGGGLMHGGTYILHSVAGMAIPQNGACGPMSSSVGPLMSMRATSIDSRLDKLNKTRCRH